MQAIDVIPAVGMKNIHQQRRPQNKAHLVFRQARPQLRHHLLRHHVALLDINFVLIDDARYARTRAQRAARQGQRKDTEAVQVHDARKVSAND